jgi:hypothetical protein
MSFLSAASVSPGAALLPSTSAAAVAAAALFFVCSRVFLVGCSFSSLGVFPSRCGFASVAGYFSFFFLLKVGSQV